MIKTISYLGLGTMGSGMASNLLKAGYELTVWNRSTEKCEPFRRNGAHVADTPADAVRDADLVMYSLSNDQAVEEVVFGSKGILSRIKEGQIAMDMRRCFDTGPDGDSNPAMILADIVPAQPSNLKTRTASGGAPVYVTFSPETLKHVEASEPQFAVTFTEDKPGSISMVRNLK